MRIEPEPCGMYCFCQFQQEFNFLGNPIGCQFNAKNSGTIFFFLIFWPAYVYAHAGKIACKNWPTG